MSETTQVHQVLIKASAQQIWDAITRPEFSERYFHGVRVETSGRAGEPYRSVTSSGVVAADEIVLESAPPYLMVVPWRSLYDPELAAEPASRVTYAIKEQKDGVCLLTVTHDRLERSPKTARSVGGVGWRTVIDGLKTLLETGDSLFPALPSAVGA